MPGADVPDIEVVLLMTWMFEYARIAQRFP